MTPAQKIEASQTFLSQLQQSILRIIDCHPLFFEGGELGRSLHVLKDACEKSVQQLQKPSLRISTIGTTSSGKSTLVNAIIGRRLAPMGHSLMSAGILTFVHAEKTRLIVEETANAVWETGEWQNLEDDEIYLKLKAVKEQDGYDGVMVAYHKAKRKKTGIEAPRVRIEAPILPVLVPEYLNLPEGIQFEISDLPGLKWVKDRHNLKLIRDTVENTFSLVVMDYTETDENSRGGVLNELKEIVSAIHGQTDATIFLLNKINLHNEDDPPIEDRYDQLKNEIREKLELSSKPDVLGVDALLLYYIQCAWGPSRKPQPPSEQRTRLLEDCMMDCARTFRQKSREMPEAREWIYKNEDNLNNLSDKEISTLFHWAHIWSGGKVFWDILRKRLDEKFSELVIFPALNETFEAFDNFATKTEQLLELRKYSIKLEIEEKRQYIIEAQHSVSKKSGLQEQKFKQLIQEILENLSPDINSACTEPCQSLNELKIDLEYVTNVFQAALTKYEKTVCNELRFSEQIAEETIKLEEIKMAAIVSNLKKARSAYDILLGLAINDPDAQLIQMYLCRDLEDKIMNFQKYSRAEQQKWDNMANALNSARSIQKKLGVLIMKSVFSEM